MDKTANNNNNNNANSCNNNNNNKSSDAVTNGNMHKDTAIETSVLHDNNNSLGCGKTTTVNTNSATPTHANNKIDNPNLQKISNRYNNNISSSSSSSSSSSILTTAMAAANGLPLKQQQRAQPLINLQINTTTGGNFGVTVDAQISVETLKKLISKKLKVAKDRICLLHREKELQDGTLHENHLMDGSKIILIPNVETGLLAQRPENTVMQALESLNDSQVNDFLSGKTPLNLSMRLGDHMMLIQLQLSTVNPNIQTASSLGASHPHHHHHICGYRRPSLRATTHRLLAEHSREQVEKLHQKLQQQKLYQQRPKMETHERKQQLLKQQQPEILTEVAAGNENIINNATCALKKSPTASTSVSIGSVTGPIKFDYKNAEVPLGCTRVTNTTTSQIRASTSTAESKIGTKRPGSPLPGPFKKSDLSAFFEKQDVKSLQSIVKSFNANVKESTATRTTATDLDQSPIKSLSNLVSSPIKTTSITNIPQIANVEQNNTKSQSTSVYGAASKGQTLSCHDPITSQLTSCICARLNAARNNIIQCLTNNHNPAVSNSNSSEATPTKNSNTNINSSLKQCLESTAVQLRPSTSTGLLMLASSSKPAVKPSIITSTNASSETCTDILHKTANNPITRSKQHRIHHNIQQLSSSAAMALGVARTKQLTRVNANSTNLPGHSNKATESSVLAEDSINTLIAPTATAAPAVDDTISTITDTRTLAEASRNLTQTLRKLSKEVFTNKIDLSASDDIAPRKTGSGAVIESMKNHGKGIYSGTFSGTLNPALQDRYGRPKRDISTVIHILNDLLSATPQYHRGARISVESPQTAGNLHYPNSASSSTNAQLNGKLHKQQFSIKPYHPCLKCLRNMPHSHHFSNGVCNTAECIKRAELHAKTHGTTISCCIESNNPSTSTGVSHETKAKDRHTCTCRYLAMSQSGERAREEMCHKCLVEMENSKTKSKLEQLRLVMQQRKQKREARKQKGAPYAPRGFSPATTNSSSTTCNEITAAAAATTTETSTQTSLLTPTTATLAASAGSTTNSTTAGSEVAPNVIVEEVDTAA